MEHDMNPDINPLGDGQGTVQEQPRHDEWLAKETSKRNDYFLGVCILVAALLISGTVIYALGKKSGGGVADVIPPSTPPTKTPEITTSDIILGDVNAPVSVIEFADYQCPFCGRFHMDAGTQIRDQYIKTGKVKMVYRDFAFLGPESLAAASATRCAADQAKFWEYHDALFDAEIKDGQENNGNLTRDLFIRLASGVGINIAQFTGCVDAKKYDAQVIQARQDASLYGVDSTPTTFVNEASISGAQPFGVFQAAIENALKK